MRSYHPRDNRPKKVVFRASDPRSSEDEGLLESQKPPHHLKNSNGINHIGTLRGWKPADYIRCAAVFNGSRAKAARPYWTTQMALVLVGALGA